MMEQVKRAIMTAESRTMLMLMTDWGVGMTGWGNE